MRPLYLAAILPLCVALTACPTLGSSPASNASPVAVVGPDQVARSQTLVTLTGKDSYDTDGVIQAYSWRQVAGTPRVALVKATNSTSTFLLPPVFAPTTLEFELTVTDDKGATGTRRVQVDALPPADPDRFLTFLETPATFKVVAATPGATPADAGTAFSVGVTTQINYRVYVNGVAQARTKTYDQSVSGQWPAAGSGGADPDDYRNPRFTFDLPKVRFQELLSDLKDNERLFNSERNALQVTTKVTLTSDADTELFLLDGAGNRIRSISGTPLPGAGGTAASPASLTFSSADGTLDELFSQSDTTGTAISDEENKKTAEAYYKAIDPNNDKDTLTKFKAADGFVDGDPNTVEVTYINGFDLGFARHMFMRKDADGNVYSYVINAPNIQSAESNVNTIAAVAMEYSPAPGAPPSDPNKYTKFYTFVLNPTTGEQERVLTMDFDGRGEKYQPGTCMGCHGGKPAELNPDGTYPNNGDVGDLNLPSSLGNHGAGFLPWDVSTLFFSSDDFENDVHTVKPTPDQLDALRRLNEMVLSTNPPDAEKALIHGWYGSTDLTATTLPPGAAFNPDFVPDGWLPGNPGGPSTGEAADAKTLYLQVVAPFCRACHSQRTDPGKPNISLDSYTKFTGYRNTIGNLVFDQGVMPLARHTMDNLWTEKSPSAASILASKLGIAATRTPGAPKAAIGRVTANGTSSSALSGTATVNISGGATTVRLNGDESLFADTMRWTLVSKPSTSAAALVGDTTHDPAFSADVAGDYEVQLIVNNGVSDSAATSVTVTAIGTPAASITFQQVNDQILVVSGSSTDCYSCHNGGFTPSFSQTDAAANYSATQPFVDTSNPKASLLLTMPSSPSPTHPGNVRPGFGDISTNTSDCGDSPAPPDYSSHCYNYDKVLQWIQLGAPGP